MPPLLDTPRLPAGFLAAGRHIGLKTTGPDLALFHSSAPASAAGLFTRNHFPGAPVLLGRERLRSGRLQTVVVNSKVSNVATGAEGLEDARTMARLAARTVQVSPELVLVASTGVIGRRLPMDRIREGLDGMGQELEADPWPAARAIMTTDSHPKVLSAKVGDAVITAVGKGAGMVAPNMATMLVYIFTDARISPEDLDRSLRRACRDSFQLLSIDTDTSTSDMVVALANGLAGEVESSAFGAAMAEICLKMSELIARDAEGATKLLRVGVRGALNSSEARRVARAVVDSPLVKTMAYGADPNVGRLLMAVGKCVECRIVPERVDVDVQGIPVIRAGQQAEFEEGRVRSLLAGDPVEIEIRLGVGEGRATALGCDLTEGYIEENAAYTSS